MNTFYWRSNCSTCRDARKILRANNFAFEARDFLKEPLTRTELEEIIDANNVSLYLNSRHPVFKANNWKEKPPTKSQAIAAILQDNKVIRRPIIKIGKRYIVGFDKEVYAQLK
jgi:Spx/MgsR family transcriptional regulator